MYCTKKITDDLYWVGANDRRLAMFEGVYSVPKGVSYNSYLLLDESTVLMDTVDKAVARTFFENVEHELAGRKLDYVVVQHMEPDHSATLDDLLRRHPETTVVCNQKTAAMMQQFFGVEYRTKIVKEGDRLNTGKHELTFVMAPMVHWPEVMVTFDLTDGTLFSADAFGCFGAINGAMFADEVNFERDYMDEARRYYCNIVGKYGPQVQALLKKAATLEIHRICPLHGFVWRKNLGDFITKYNAWSSYTPEVRGVLIAYASVYGNTENTAEVLSGLLRDRGIKTEMFDVSVTPASEIVAAAFKYSHLVFASTTYNAGIFVTMDELLRDIAAHGLRNRRVALIQNGSWAPTAGGLMREILSSCKDMYFYEPLVTIKSAPTLEQRAQLETLANTISDELTPFISARAVSTEMIDLNSLYRFTYGMFVLSARTKDGKDVGCIVNTAQQVTNEPNRICVSVNKQNYTHDIIVESGVFNLSILSIDADFEVFKRFGFVSSRDVDKFTDSEKQNRSANGLVYLPGEVCCAVVSGQVVASYDLGTHTMFIADITEARKVPGAPPMNYEDYLVRVKPRPQPRSESKGKVWVCRICGYTYCDAEEAVPFEQLPDDWVCPLCKHPKSDFELQQ